MPRICTFYGIVISMYYKEHAPPHFNASYSGHEAAYGMDSLEVVHGSLPARANALVLEWASLHRGELQANWDRARKGRKPDKIEPLA